MSRSKLGEEGKTKNYLLLSRNRSPKKVNLTPQNLYFKQSPGKIYPAYIETINFEDLDKKDCTWVNIHVNINFDDLYSATNKLTGEVQRLNIICKTHKEIIPCILQCMKTIDDRKDWESYESLYFIMFGAIKIAQIGYLGKTFIFDMFLLPKKYVTEYATISKKVNEIVYGLNFDHLRSTGNLDLKISNKVIRKFEFRDSSDISRIFKHISGYKRDVELFDISDRGFNNNENSFINKVKLCTTSIDRIDSIVSKIKKSDRVTKLKFFIRYDHIQHVSNRLPKCRKFYCLLSDEDIGETFSIGREGFSEEQQLVADNIEKKYPNLKFVFLANRIFDKNVPSNFSKFVSDNFEDKSIDEADGLKYPNSDDLDLSD